MSTWCVRQPRTEIADETLSHYLSEQFTSFLFVLFESEKQDLHVGEELQRRLTCSVSHARTSNWQGFAVHKRGEQGQLSVRCPRSMGHGTPGGNYLDCVIEICWTCGVQYSSRFKVNALAATTDKLEPQSATTETAKG